MGKTIKTGDKVTIVNYGHLMWQRANCGLPEPPNVLDRDGNIIWYDSRPEMVGKEARVVMVNHTERGDKFALNIAGLGYMAWFTINQLEKKI